METYTQLNTDDIHPPSLTNSQPILNETDGSIGQILFSLADRVRLIERILLQKFNLRSTDHPKSYIVLRLVGSMSTIHEYLSSFHLNKTLRSIGRVPFALADQVREIERILLQKFNLRSTDHPKSYIVLRLVGSMSTIHEYLNSFRFKKDY